MNPLSTWTFYIRHKRQTALLLCMSAVVTIGLNTLVALIWGVFVEPARLSFLALSNFSIVTPDYDEKGPNSWAITRIQNRPDIESVIPTTFLRVTLPSLIPGEGHPFDILGLREEDIPDILKKCRAALKEGHLPEPGRPGLLLSENIASILDVTVGETYDVIPSEFYANIDSDLEATTFEVVGILESDVELGLVSLEFLLGQKQYSQFPARYLIMARENHEAAVDDFLRSEIQTVQTAVITQTMLRERVRNEALPGLLMLLPINLLVAIAFSLVFVTINHIAYSRRLPELGILHAIGLNKRWLIRRLTRETTTLATVGWVVGIGLAWLLLYFLDMTLFAPRGYNLSFIPWIPIAFTLPIPGMIAATTFTIVRRTLSRLDPVAIVERGELSEEPSFQADEDRIRGGIASNSSTKPLAPWTFYKRHRKRAVLLVSGMGVMIIAVTIFNFALAVSAEAQVSLLRYLNQVSIVRSPGIGHDLDPDVLTQVRTHPAVERVIPVAPRFHMLSAHIPPFSGAEASPFAVYAEDMAYLVKLYDLELREGSLPRPFTNEMVIPEALAQNRELKIGDVIGDLAHPAYPGAPTLEAEFVISGIFAQPPNPKDENWLGFVSLEYLETYEPFPLPDVLPLILVPKTGQKEALDNWLADETGGLNASVLTYRGEVASLREKARQDMLGIAMLESVIAIVAAVSLAVLNYIHISQRRAEFGVLHALGYSRLMLAGRALWETVFATGSAWIFSVMITLVGMLGVRFGIFGPRGLAFNFLYITAWLYTLPIPIAVIAVTLGTIARTLSKLDPVSIIERR